MKYRKVVQGSTNNVIWSLHFNSTQLQIWDDEEYRQWTQLCLSVDNQDLGRLKKLIGEGFDVNLQWPRFREEHFVEIKKKKTYYTAST